ncbi:protein translocase subunit SecDF [Flammeovirga kamogawensis]|uniref:Multifunctional fusion protein n=1 Tax=Flammeovirga kamogawensis TaxID=373891 RepID=A0ABX8GU30_9BACT|nr:protein translocase subunit SecDF [Flammeovirga kamogawensis]MBB6459881.1 SecD/SecF fusion protein [Flammeovirga kamogawensis]QWG07066.1 protein translocase subunit SecDF [Flammeovirga kamogawensis]TRX68887.1 protein translocase subunit SecDF [Flammeovirga kamogawensis]
MRNRGFVLFIAITVTLFSLFDLSFTVVSRSVQNSADEYAMDSKGHVDYFKKQAYIDSVWKLPVYDLGFTSYTYEEVKNKELALGLDLQGGMSVTLEVSPIEVIKAMAGSNVDAAFEKSIAAASAAEKENRESFTDNFFSALEENAPNVPFATYFATSSNKGRISFNSPNDKVKKLVESEVDGAVDRAFEIIRTRIDKFGVTQPNIQRLQGTNRISIELPGVDNPERVRNLVQGVAKLEFLEVWTNQEAQPYIFQMNQAWVKQEEARKKLSGDVAKAEAPKKEASENSLFEGDSTTAAADSAKVDETSVSPLLAKMQGGLVYADDDTAAVNKMLRDTEVMDVIPSDMKFIWAHKPLAEQNGKSFYELFPVKKDREAKLGGDVITDAIQTFDQRAQPAVSMSMNVEGAKKWKKMTGQNLGRRIAIALDNEVYTAPTVNSEIDGGRSEITGSFDINEAKDLANVLKAGKLPAPTRIIEEVVVGPSLGKVAQSEGLNSVLLGLSLVIVFMIVYYAKGGIIANVALLSNIFFIVGILAELGAALTLPGIAGIVLTIGMSIDANVLIFERIREEQRAGKSLLQAINNGYDRAFWTIFDANVTTLLTGAFLYVFGMGPIKGFAVTLMIGIVCSFFSAVFISRLIVSYFTNKYGEKTKLSFETGLSKKLAGQSNYDFMGKRKIAYAASVVVIIAGLASLSINGLNLGVDFTGGRSYIVNFDKVVVPSKLQASLVKDFDGKSVEVKTYGNEQTLKITTAYLVDDESTEADTKVQQIIVTGIEKFTGDKYSDKQKVDAGTFVIPSTSKVGATIADDITDGAEEAVLFSLLGIFAYIWVRFRRANFGIGAIAALVHDTLIVFGAFGIANLLGAGFELDQVFIAAILTVIGYSINDTVVVFDRVREEEEGSKDGDQLINVINKAINGTLNRTIITSFTTLLVIFVLLVFGGEALRGFSFSLFVGIMVGTYSSIFIAAPVVFDTSKKEIRKKATETAAVKA